MLNEAQKLLGVHSMRQSHTWSLILLILHFLSVSFITIIIIVYRIRGLFGGDFNLVVWRIFIGSPNLNHAVLTCTHKMN